MASGSWRINGSYGGTISLNLESHEVSVDTANNRSLIEITLYVYNNSYSGTAIYDNAGDASWGLSGTEAASGNFTYSYSSPGQSTYFLNGNQYWVGHNSDGTGSVSLSCSVNCANSPYLTTASGSISYNLTTINRYSNVTGFSSSAVSDVGFTLSVSVDNSASSLGFSIDGGSTYSSIGSGTSASQTFTGLKSGTSYSCYAKAVNANSGFVTYSSNLIVPTTVQNNFIGIGVL